MASIRVAAIGSTVTRAYATALVTSGTDCGEASVRALSEARVSGDDVGRFVLTGPDPPFLPESHQIPSRRLYPGSALANARTSTRRVRRSKAPSQTPAKIRAIHRRRQHQRDFRSMRTRFEGQRAHAGPRRQHRGQLVEPDPPRERGPIDQHPGDGLAGHDRARFGPGRLISRNHVVAVDDRSKMERWSKRPKQR